MMPGIVCAQCHVFTRRIAWLMMRLSLRLLGGRLVGLAPGLARLHPPGIRLRGGRLALFPVSPTGAGPGRRAGRTLAAGLLLALMAGPCPPLAPQARAQTQIPGQPTSQQLAYPPGTTRSLLQLLLLLTAGVALLTAVNRLFSRRAERGGEASLAKESRALKQLKIGYPEGMTFLEELRRLCLLEDRLSPLGVDIIWTSFPSASTLLSALSKGEIDFCGGGGTASIFSQAAGHVFVRVAREKYPDLQGEAILVRPESRLHNLLDLKGATVAFDEGSSAHYVLIRALQIVGLSYGDIKPLPLPQNQALYRFQEGHVDAWVVWMPYAPTEARRRYPGRSIADLNSILGDHAAQEVPTLYYSTPELVRDYPRVLKAILEEVNEAGVRHNQRQLEDALKNQGKEELDPETLQSLRQRCLERAILPLDDPTLRSLQHQATILQDLRLIADRINVHDSAYSLLTRQNWTY
jgi:sulfonate transport system substrate-binding protein